MSQNEKLQKVRVRPCGDEECSISTFIDEVSLTFGKGELYSHGDWEQPCRICAEAYKRDNPKSIVLGLPD